MNVVGNSNGTSSSRSAEYFLMLGGIPVDRLVVKRRKQCRQIDVKKWLCSKPKKPNLLQDSVFSLFIFFAIFLSL